MSNEIALRASSVPTKIGETLPVLGDRFRIKAHVTRSVLRQDETPVFFMTAQSAIKQAERAMTFDGKPAGKFDNPPWIMDILNLETGEYQTLVCNQVFMSELNRAYPEESYVGKYFAVAQQKGGITGDKRYRSYKILELEEVGGQLKSAGKGVIDGTTDEVAERASGKHRKVV